MTRTLLRPSFFARYIASSTLMKAESGSVSEAMTPVTPKADGDRYYLTLVVKAGLCNAVPNLLGNICAPAELLPGRMAISSSPP